MTPAHLPILSRLDLTWLSKLSQYMADMASRRTTVVLTSEDERGLRVASLREGVSQSELIRRGIRKVIAPYVRRRKLPKVGWLRLSASQRAEILRDDFTDLDA
jgi:hypothetical protein